MRGTTLLPMKAGSTVWGLVPVLGWFLSIGELFFDTLPQPLTPSGKAFQETYRNCFSNIMIPWHGPIGLKGVRLSIPIDLADGDYVAMAAGFDAFEWKYEDGEKYDKKIESAFIEIHDVLNSEQNDDPPLCGCVRSVLTRVQHQRPTPGQFLRPHRRPAPSCRQLPLLGQTTPRFPHRNSLWRTSRTSTGWPTKWAAAKNNYPEGIWSDWATVWGRGL